MCLENINLTERSILLIRHAQSETNIGKFYPDDSIAPLSEKGRLDAKRFAEHLKVHPANIYSSPFRRATETASYIRKNFADANFEILENLKEFQYTSAKDRLEWIRKTRSFLVSENLDWRDSAQTETIRDLISRANSVFVHLQTISKRPILVITHQFMIQAILSVQKSNTNDMEEISKFFLGKIKTSRIQNLETVKLF